MSEPPLICDTCRMPKTKASAAIIVRPTGPPEAPVMIRSVECLECCERRRIAAHGGRAIAIPKTGPTKTRLSVRIQNTGETEFRRLPGRPGR